MLTRSIQLATAAALAAGLLAGCGTHAAPTATSAAAAAVAAQAKKSSSKTTSGKRPAPPAVEKKSGPARQGFAASQAARACDNALQNYQSLTYQWSSAYSDYDKDQIETQMLNVLHQALQDTQNITSAQGVDAADRRSYDLADSALNSYDANYRRWQMTWDDTSKRYIVNQMLQDMVGALQQIRANY